MQRCAGQKIPVTLNPRKKTHRVATVGFLFSKSQLADASVGLESVANANSCAAELGIASVGDASRVDCCIHQGGLVVDGLRAEVQSSALAQRIVSTNTCQLGLRTSLVFVVTNLCHQSDGTHGVSGRQAHAFVFNNSIVGLVCLVKTKHFHCTHGVVGTHGSDSSVLSVADLSTHTSQVNFHLANRCCERSLVVIQTDFCGALLVIGAQGGAEARGCLDGRGCGGSSRRGGLVLLARPVQATSETAEVRSHISNRVLCTGLRGRALDVIDVHGAETRTDTCTERLASGVGSQRVVVDSATVNGAEATAESQANFTAAKRSSRSKCLITSNCRSGCSALVGTVGHSVELRFKTEVGLQAATQVFGTTEVDLGSARTVTDDTGDGVGSAFVVDGSNTNVHETVNADSGLSERSASGGQCSQSSYIANRFVE
jgi:hypothetical protein